MVTQDGTGATIAPIPPAAGPSHGAALMSGDLRSSLEERGMRPRRFAITNHGSRWTLEGLGHRQPLTFPDLASALAHARRESDADEAMIELRVDGLYVCVHQPKGWPQRICGTRAPA